MTTQRLAILNPVMRCCYVFAMSAIVAIGLYEQLPRAAFEAQREKERS